MLKRALIIIVVVVGGFLAFAATRPDTYHVERSAKIDAPAPVVFGQLADFKAWAAWSPWDKLDPAMKKTYEGPATGVGAAYAWQGNDKVGKGRMTVTESQPPTQIKFKLEFLEPMTATATTGFALTADGDRSTSVTWSTDGDNKLMGKIVGIFMNMDTTIGRDFETGLAGLQTVAAAEAKKQAEAVAKAQADAAAAAAAKVEADAAAAKAAEEAAAAAAKGKGKGKGKH